MWPRSACTIPIAPIQVNDITHCGWQIKTTKRGIVGDAHMQEISTKLDVRALPEQLFADNSLKLVHEASGTCLAFNAVDALKGWKEENVPPLQVNLAKTWQSSRKQEIMRQNAVILAYDWTFTTPYSGSTDSTWQESTEQIDRAMLMEREPILFYEDLPLFESDLDDFGTCQLGVKVRVMPKCWFVLLRFWLKVDNNLVRLRETRYFCKFDRDGGGQAVPEVVKETRHVEGTFEELRAAGAPPEGPAYTDSDSASAALMAAAPVGVVKFTVEKLVT
jgi:type 2A phosphatase activator TIP41